MGLSEYTLIPYFLLLAIGTSVAAANAVHKTLERRTFWVFLAIGFGLWTLDQWFWVYYKLGQQIEIPDSSVAEPVLFLHVIFFLAALTVRPDWGQPGQSHHQTTLNFLLILLSWTFLYSFFVFPYQFLFVNSILYNLRFDHVYFAENFALIAVLAILIFRAQQPWKAVYWHLFGAASVYAVGSLASNTAHDLGGYYTGHWSDFVIIISFCWFVWVPLSARRLAVSRVPERQASGAGLQTTSVLAMLAIPLLGTWELYQGDSEPMQRVRLLEVLGFMMLLALGVFIKWYFENRELKQVAILSEEMRHKSEERFRGLVQSVDAIVWEADAKTLRVSFVSQGAERILGYVPQRWTETQNFWADHVHPDDRARALACEREAVTKGKPVSVEYRMITANDRVVWFRDFMHPFLGADGKPEWLRGIMLDITESREAEEDLRHSEDRYRDLVEHSRDLICTHDLTGKLLSVNQEPARILGYTREELLNKDMRAILPSEVRDKFDEYLANISRDGKAQGLLVVLTRSGERRIWEYNNTLRTEGVHEPVVRGMASDVTERMRAEKTLRKSEERFSKAFNASPEPMTISTLSGGDYIDVNEAFLRITGYRREEVVGRSAQDIKFWTEPDARARLLGALQRGPVREMEISFATKSGEARSGLLSAEVIEVGGQPCLLAVTKDVTERKRAEEALAESQVRMTALVESTGDMIWSVDAQNFRLLTFNNALKTYFARTPCPEVRLGMTPEDLLPPQLAVQWREFYQLALREGSLTTEYVSGLLSRVLLFSFNVLKRGKEVFGISVFAKDITERKQAEEALHQSEQRYRDFVAHSAEGVWRVEFEQPIPIDLPEEEVLEKMRRYGYLAECNEALARIYGVASKAELVGARFGDLVLPSDVQWAGRVWELIRSGFKTRIVEAHFNDRQGYLKDVQITETPIVVNGMLLRMWGITRDITEHKRAEEARRASEERYRLMFEANPGPMWVYDLSSLQFLAVNQAAIEHYGYSRDEFLSMTIKDIRPSEDVPALLNEIAHLKAGIDRAGTWRHRKKDRSLIDVEITSQQVAFGGRSAELVLVNDVTERRRVEEGLRESEERFRSLVENASVGIYRTTPQGRILMANPTLIAMLRCKSLEELITRNLEEQGFEPDYPRRAFRERLEREGEVKGLEAAWTRQDGSVIFVRESARVVRGESGNVLYYDGIVEDITERKRSEEALRKSEAELKEAHRIARLGNWSMNLKTGKARWSNEVYRMLGLDPSLPPPPYSEHGRLFTPESWTRLTTELDKTVRTGVPYELELETVRPDGSRGWILDRGEPVRDAEGAITDLRGVAMDIAERKRAEERIKASEEKFRKAFMTGADAFYIATLNEGRFMDVNDRFEDVFGYHRNEVIGKTALDLGLYADPDDWQKVVSQFKSNGYVRNIELTGRKKSGDLIKVLLSANLLQGSDEQIILGVIRDITERIRAEHALVRLRQAVDTSGEVVFMTDPKGIITFINPEFTRLYGYEEEEVVGKVTPRILKGGSMQPEDYATFWKTILDKRVARGEMFNRTKDGHLVSVEVSVNPILDEHGNITGYLAIQIDVTRRKELEEQFRQAQKMEAVGRLAGGVAHDFNNILTVINGYSEVMLEQAKPENPHLKYVNEIKKAGERAAALTRQLLAFSRQQVLAPQVLDLNQVIANVHAMLNRLIGEDIDLVMIPGQGLGRVKADPGQIEQVLLNLAVNARDAMPRGGKLSIETTNVELDESHARGDFVVRPGPYVMLAVSDSGTGMDAETQKRIFEPFFTTKEKGKGTGLGLSTVYGIVKQSDGYITVYSEVGHGTTFKVYLPRLDAPVEVVGPAITVAGMAGGQETVLLVEDDTPIRRLISDTLKSKGYKVLEASNGEEALATAGKHRQPIQLLLTDLVMPGMSGRILAERMAVLHPESKVLYMSGYTDDAVIRHGGLGAGGAFLQKPFTPDAVANKVRQVLDAT